MLNPWKRCAWLSLSSRSLPFQLLPPFPFASLESPHWTGGSFATVGAEYFHWLSAPARSAQGRDQMCWGQVLGCRQAPALFSRASLMRLAEADQVASVAYSQIWKHPIPYRERTSARSRLCWIRDEPFSAEVVLVSPSSTLCRVCQRPAHPQPLVQQTVVAVSS